MHRTRQSKQHFLYLIIIYLFFIWVLKILINTAVNTVLLTTISRKRCLPVCLCVCLCRSEDGDQVDGARGPTLQQVQHARRHLVVRHRPRRDLHLRQGALRRYGVAGRSLVGDPLSYVSRSSQCSTTGVTKAVVCYDWCSNGRHLVVRHRPRRDLHLRQGSLRRYGGSAGRSLVECTHGAISLVPSDRSLVVDPLSYFSRSIGSIPCGGPTELFLSFHMVDPLWWTH